MYARVRVGMGMTGRAGRVAASALVAVGLLVARDPSALGCAPKRAPARGVIDLESQRVLFDLRGDQTVIEIDMTARVAGQPFAFLWPANRAPLAVEVSDGARFNQLDALAAPRFEAGRCDEPGAVASSVVAPGAVAAPAPVVAAAIDTAYVPSTPDALTQWFRSAGFGIPSFIDELANPADGDARIALRITPAVGQRRVVVRITLPRQGGDLRWSRLAAFGAQGELELTIYVVGSDRMRATGGVTTRELDREALASGGLHALSFDATYQAASRKLAGSDSALIVDAATETSMGFVTRLHGWLFPAQLGAELDLIRDPQGSTPLPPTFRYCVESRRLALPAASEQGAVDGGSAVEQGAGCNVASADRRAGSMAMFPLALLLALVTLGRRRSIAPIGAALVALALGTTGCKGTQVSADANAVAQACTPSVTCSSDGVQTVSCENNLPKTVVTACPLGCAPDGRSCGVLTASHVPINLLTTTGLSDLRFAPPSAGDATGATTVRSTLFFINADTGEIRADSETAGPIVRAAGTGVQAGISFTVVPQEGPKSPSLGVFVAHSVTVDLGVILRSSIAELPAGGAPPNALVIVAQEGIDLGGFIDVSGGRPTIADAAALAAGNAVIAEKPANRDERADRKGFRNPGPGGYAGGMGGVSGFGPGGGGGAGSGYGVIQTPADAVEFGLNPGGGGGGFGAAGGNGGAAFFGNAGGAGGLSSGSPDLGVLHGGSGGGAGGNDFTFANPIQPFPAGDPRIINGGEGGGGGGAIQLTALGAAGFRLRPTGGINASGAGGRHISNGFCCHVGAGGGGAGGAVLIEAARVSLEPGSFVTVNGGGGAGSDQTAGDTCCRGADGLPGTATAAPGGVGRGKGGDGGAGTAPGGQRGGTAQFTDPVTAANTGRGSGGGGGGSVGRLRIHSGTGQLTLTGAILSPDPTTSAFSSGRPPVH